MWFHFDIMAGQLGVTTFLRNKGKQQEWGVSSNGRAPALHAGGTGIDTRILQIFLFFFLTFFSAKLGLHQTVSALLLD